MFPNTLSPLLTMTVETTTLIKLGRVSFGGKLCPGLTCQHDVVRVLGVAFGWHCWIGDVNPDQPLNAGLTIEYWPLITWLSHCAPQKFTCWPIFSPPEFPQKITNPAGK